jgi:prepilin-type N-terminal cleavage/methylation domain-containing protein
VNRKSVSGFTLIEILVVVAIIGVLLTILLPRIVGVSDQANVTACQVLMKDQFTELTLYKERFGHYPTQSGFRFLGELWKTGQIDNDEKEVKLFMCPGDKDIAQRTYDEAVGKKAVFEALNHYDTLTSEYVSYACRNQKDYKIDFSKPTAQLLVSDDDEDAPNHRFKINCLYLNGAVDSVDITEFPDKVFKVGPDSALEKFRVLSD